MAIYVRPLTEEEVTVLKKALRSQNALTQRRARITLWSREGLESLSPRPRPGPPAAFCAEVADGFIHLLHQPPTAFGLETAVWSLKGIAKHPPGAAPQRRHGGRQVEAGQGVGS